MKSSLPSVLTVLVCLNLSASALNAAEPFKTMPIWPGDAPGEKGDIGEEHDITKPSDGIVAGKAVIRLGNVSKPTIAIYRPPADKDTGAAVVVCPGGGYHILAMDLEGTEVCEWLNSIGVTGVLLKYRVPRRQGQEKPIAAFQDGQRAMSVVRQHASEFGIDPKRIGILGFSAGGNLAALVSNNYTERVYPKTDSADEISCRPDFSVLIYAAYLTIKEEGDKLAPDMKITADTPPTFLAMTEDDGVRVENALYYYLALKNAKVPAELHVYPTGGHGYGLRPSEHYVTTWPQRVSDWMNSRGLLKKN